MRNLKQELNWALVLKKIYGVIEFNQKAWLNHTLVSTQSSERKKNDSEKHFFKLMNNAVCPKNYVECEKR